MLGAALLVVGAGALRSVAEDRVADPGPVHVHGLGLDSADGALFLATHTGLFRVARDSQRPVRIGDRTQDTMGFSVVGRNRFLGSGHPDPRDRSLPPLLGLIESTDGGETWKPVSLLGEADFHVLRSAGRHVYGYDASHDRLLASADRGRTWKELDKPGSIVDLAPSPADPTRIVATTGEGTYAAAPGGTWTRLNDAAGLLAWPAQRRLYLVDENGVVSVSGDGGRRLTRRGAIGGRPAALLAVAPDELYAALHDGTVKRSLDGGATWTIRSRP
jgi:hypothetical protein